MSTQHTGVSPLYKIWQIQRHIARHVPSHLQQTMRQVLGVDVVVVLGVGVEHDNALCVEEICDEFVTFRWWIFSTVVVEPLRLQHVQFLKLR